MSHRFVLWSVTGFILLLVSIVFSMSIGSAHIPVADVWWILLAKIPVLSGYIPYAWDEASEQIVWLVRAPRVLLAILVGATLALAGTAFQGVLRNPLAEPYTLGVASGSAVGALAVILLGAQYSLIGSWAIPLAAFLSGLLTLWAVLTLARRQGKIEVETLILSGVVIQAFFGSIVSFIISFSGQSLNKMMFWLMGSLALKSWSESLILLPYLLIGFLLLMNFCRELNLFSLGERQAFHLGVRIERTKLLVLIVSTLLTAAAVSIAGIISFVGLVIPHILRMIVGPDYRLLMPLSLIYGGIYVLWADTLSRMLLDPQIIPLGVITSILGAPFFAYLLVKRRNAKGESI
jgi:iron complex transport system permease protein